MPYMLDPGEDRIIADAHYLGLTKPGHYDDPIVPSGTPSPVQGKWAVSIQYSRGLGEQYFTLQQNGNDLTGTQQGELYRASLKGRIRASQIELHSSMEVSGNSVPWNFKGEVQGSSMAGIVTLGEYGQATWKAIRS